MVLEVYNYAAGMETSNSRKILQGFCIRCSFQLQCVTV